MILIARDPKTGRFVSVEPVKPRSSAMPSRKSANSSHHDYLWFVLALVSLWLMWAIAFAYHR